MWDTESTTRLQTLAYHLLLGESVSLSLGVICKMGIMITILPRCWGDFVCFPGKCQGPGMEKWSLRFLELPSKPLLTSVLPRPGGQMGSDSHEQPCLILPGSEDFQEHLAGPSKQARVGHQPGLRNAGGLNWGRVETA